ncbi:MAG TPA: C13 family peptidase, partial [Steroidobacteraceae bacterium]|nr:C13 family peptidase [Steroidobacteraceae bacterium]
VVTTLTQDDWRALNVAHAARTSGHRTIRRRVIEIVAIASVSIGLLALAARFNISVSAPNILSGMVLLGVILMNAHRTANARLQNEALDSILGEHQYEFDASGIHVVDRRIDARFAWAGIRDVSADRERIFIWVRLNSALIVPCRDLPAEASPESAVAFLREHIAASSVVEQHPQAASAAPLWWKVIPYWWALRVTTPVNVTDRAIVILSLASIFLWSVLDRFRVGDGAVFNSYNIPTLALCALAILGLARVIAKRSSEMEFRTTLFTVLAVLPLAIAANFVIDTYLSGLLSIVLLLGLVVYVGVFLAFALRSQSGARQPQSAWAAMAMIAVLAAISTEFYWTPSLWYVPESGEEGGEQPTWSRGESLLFNQQARIDQALTQVATHDPATASNFFVGFAGVADQKVFAEEIGLAARVIADRYGTGTRTLLLLNDRRDVESQPLATVSGLAYALKGIAAKMDVERDVLFLSLSSHGSDEPELQVSNGVLPLSQVTGDNLAAALNDSGIKYRVLIVSACHAGAFIELLQNENTIIITAAAKEKTSFGCSDDRDLTYFGEAFYRDALPKSASLHEAFDAAKAAITAREKAEDFTPSDPQAYFGAELEAKLQR